MCFMFYHLRIVQKFDPLLPTLDNNLCYFLNGFKFNLRIANILFCLPKLQILGFVHWDDFEIGQCSNKVKVNIVFKNFKCRFAHQEV